MGFRKQRLAAVAVAATGFCCAPAWASPWGRENRETLYIQRLEAYHAERDGRRFDQTSTTAYVEIGVAQGWTVGGKAAIGTQDISRTDVAFSRDGIVDAELFVQKKVLASGRHAVSLQTAYIPRKKTGEALLDSIDRREDEGLRTAIQYGYGGDKHFIATSIGYRKSLGDDADRIRADLTIGRHRDDGGMYLIDTYTNVSVTDATGLGIDYDMMTVAPSAVFKVGKTSNLQIGARFDVAGRNIDRGQGVFVSLWVLK